MLFWLTFLVPITATNPLKSAASSLTASRVGSFSIPSEIRHNLNISQILISRPDVFTNDAGFETFSEIMKELNLSSREIAVEYFLCHSVPEVDLAVSRILEGSNDVVLASLIAAPVFSADAITLKPLIDLAETYLDKLRRPCMIDEMPGYLQSEKYEMVFFNLGQSMFHVSRHPEEGIVAIIRGQELPETRTIVQHKNEDFVMITVYNKTHDEFSYSRIFDLQTGRGIQYKLAKRELVKVPDMAAVALRDRGGDAIHILGWKGSDNAPDAMVPEMSVWIDILFADDFIAKFSNEEWILETFTFDPSVNLFEALSSLPIAEIPLRPKHTWNDLPLSDVFRGFTTQSTSGFLFEHWNEDLGLAIFTKQADEVLKFINDRRSTLRSPRSTDPANLKDVLCTEVLCGEFLRSWRAIRQLGVPDIYDGAFILQFCLS